MGGKLAHRIHLPLFDIKVEINFKVTIHIGTDQNFEIEIFAEYKYTLNELLVKRKCFSVCLIVCEI